MSIQKVKYPRTYHLPYSLTLTDDDKRLSSDEHFKDFTEVIVTAKMDGENTTVYPDGTMHARSLDGNKHEWQTWLKTDMQRWCYDIPEGWRVCGENLYAQHSIAYHFSSASKFFQVFGIYDDKNICIAWDKVTEWCELLGIEHVPVIYRGAYDKDAILNAFKEFQAKQDDEVEGFVVRNAAEFKLEDFAKNVGKFVRANHVQTDAHWTEHWKPNIVKGV